MSYIRDHTAAVLDRLAEHEKLAGRIIDGLKSTNEHPMAPPYLVVTSSTPETDNDRLTGTEPSRLEFEFLLNAAGEDRFQAQAFAEAAMEQLSGWAPTVAGWNPERMKRRPENAWPIRADTNFTPPVLYTTDRYLLRSRKG